MARVRLLKPYNLKQPGDVIEVSGGIASVLILQKTAELYRELVEEDKSQESHANDNGQRLVEKTITKTVGDVSVSTTEKFESATPISLGTVTVAVTDLPEYQALLAQLATAREASDGLRWALEASEARLVLAEELARVREEEIMSLQELLEAATGKEKTDLPTDANQAETSETSETTKPKNARGSRKPKAEPTPATNGTLADTSDTRESPEQAESEQSPVDETASSVVSEA